MKLKRTDWCWMRFPEGGWRMAVLGGLLATSVIACNQDQSPQIPGLPQMPLTSMPGSQQLSGHMRPELLSAHYIGPTERDRLLTVTIGLPVRDLNDMERMVVAVSDPRSSRFRQFLSTDEIADRYGVSPDDYQRAVAWAERQGLEVETNPHRFVLIGKGSVDKVEAAFHVNIVNGYRSDGTLFYGPDREPSVDLDVPIKDVSDLDNYDRPRPAWSGGSGLNGWFWGNDFRNAYLPCGGAGTGTGQGIGILSLGAGFKMSDITKYETQSGLTGVPPVLVNGTNPGTVAGPEDTADIDMALSMAPGAQVTAFRGNFNDALTHMTQHQEIKQFSSSYHPSGINSTTRSLIATLALHGQSFFQSSGDSGAIPPGPPSNLGGAADFRTLPAVTVVGGTELNMQSPGVSRVSETGWSGSSGGVLTSSVNSDGVAVPIPSYQVGLGNGSYGVSNTYRNIPDVAGPASGIEIFLDSFSQLGGGTSTATPLWAGFMALINEKMAAYNYPSLGFANPSLYAMARTVNYGNFFYDVTSGTAPSQLPGGSGFSYSATTGYDLVTGLGTPGCILIPGLLAPLNFHFSPAISARGSGTYEIFAVKDDDKTILHRTYVNGTGYGAWEALPGGILPGSSPASVSWASNRIDMFDVDHFAHLQHAWWNNDGNGWQAWEDLGCCFDTAPTVASWGSGRLDVFVGSQGSIWHKWYDISGGGWQGPGQEPTGLSNMAGAPAAVSWGVNRIDIIVRDTNGNIQQTYYNNPTGWGGWLPLGSGFDTSPTVSTWGPNRLDVFAGMGGNLMHTWYNGVWNGWEPSLGGNMASAPSATAWASGRIDIMAFTADPGNELEHFGYQGGWLGWSAVRTPFYAAP